MGGWSAAWPTARRRLVKLVPQCATVLPTSSGGGLLLAHESTPVSRALLEQVPADHPDADELWPIWKSWGAAGRRGAVHAAQLDGALKHGVDSAWIREPVRSSPPRVDTIYGATCVILAPEHRWPRVC